MTVRKIEIGCDTPDCWAALSAAAEHVEDVREYSTEWKGWTHRDGEDFCGPCSRGNTPQARAEAR